MITICTDHPWRIIMWFVIMSSCRHHHHHHHHHHHFSQSAQCSDTFVFSVSCLFLQGHSVFFGQLGATPQPPKAKWNEYKRKMRTTTTTTRDNYYIYIDINYKQFVLGLMLSSVTSHRVFPISPFWTGTGHRQVVTSTNGVAEWWWRTTGSTGCCTGRFTTDGSLDFRWVSWT